MGQYNRFRNKKPYKPRHPASPQVGEFERVRIPHEGEVLGMVVALVGGTRLIVDCKDGKERMCRIPGRLKKKIWIKENDVVIVEPWSIEGEKKGDIVWRYNPIDVSWLKRKGYL